MKKCPQCGSTNLTEIAPNNGRRQWLCSDCGKVSRSKSPDTIPQKEVGKGKWINKLTDEPEQEKLTTDASTEVEAAQNMCDVLYKNLDCCRSPSFRHPSHSRHRDCG